MYSAPAVSYPVGRSYFHGRLLTLVLLPGAASLLAWGWQSDAIGFRQLAAMALWLISAGVALLAWWRSPSGSLNWDGQNWTWTCDDVCRVLTVQVVLDAQNAMLLQLRAPDKPACWVWPERRSLPVRWLSLRRAVFAPQPLAQRADAGWLAP